MKNSIILSVILGTLVLAGCSPKVTTSLIKAKAPLGPGEEVTVLQPEQSQPEDAVVLETIRMQGNDYGELVTLAEEKARTAGGNILKIATLLARYHKPQAQGRSRGLIGRRLHPFRGRDNERDPGFHWIRT